jgi:probable FeS assembly SUF system protein SufT
MYHTNEPVTFNRNCSVTLIPNGDEVELPEGAFGYITQELGGSFTIYIEGNLFRLSGKDADAIGKEAMIIPIIQNPKDYDHVSEIIWQQLKSCYDPEIPVNIVDLGLIYKCEVLHENDNDENYQVNIEMTLTAPGCGMGPILMQDVKEKIEGLSCISNCNVELVFDPPWNQSMMSDEAKLQTGML